MSQKKNVERQKQRKSWEQEEEIDSSYPADISSEIVKARDKVLREKNKNCQTRILYQQNNLYKRKTT